MDYSYEVVKYNKNIPAMILMQNKPGWRCRTQLHWHKELELIYMIRGHLDITVGGFSKKIDDGELFFCNSGDIHITDVKDDNSFNRYIVVLLSYDYMRNYCKDIEKIRFFVDGNPDARNEIIEAMKRLVELCENSNDVFSDITKNIEILKIYHILLKQCAVYKKNIISAKAPDKFSNIKKVIEYIGENYTEEIALDDMAELAGLSPVYFSKCFKNLTGTCFKKYLDGIRLEHAIKDMLTRNMTVTEAAFENGFPNVKSFITNCKKTYGYTPAKYKLHYPEY